MSVRVDNTADLLTRTANLPSTVLHTVCGWSYMQSDLGSVYQTLAVFEGAGSYLGLFWEGGTANVMVVERTGSTGSFGSRPATAAWFFWALSCAGTAGTDLKGYWALAGDASLTTVSTTGLSFSPATLFIGNSGASERIDGRLAYVKCWDAVLTPEELMVERNSAVPRRLANLNFYWPLWDAANTADFGGNARNPTVGGTFTTEDGPPVRVSAGRRIRRYRRTPPVLFMDDQGLVARLYRTKRVVNG